LNSASAPERAWGAYLAQKNDLKQFIPDLIEMLRPLADEPSPDHWLLPAVLDSLIQMGADVPSDAIMSLTGYTTHKLILLSRNPSNYKDALLDLMRNNKGKEWLAAGNLLTEVRGPGLASLLLNDLHISVSIAVVDPASGIGIGSGWGSGGAGDGFVAVPEQYPPIGFYGLADYPRRGFIVLAPGPKTIYYYRLVVDSGAQSGWGDSGLGFDYNEARCEYLAALLKTTPADLTLKSSYDFTEEWKGRAPMIRRFKQIRSQVEAKYESVVSKLVNDGLLQTTEAAGLEPKIEFHVSDLRTDRSVPLPDSPLQ
jgi:hypothetical protein